MVGSELLAETAAVMGGDRFAQGRQPARRRILVRALFERPRGRVENLVRPAEIRETLAKVDRAMRRGQPRHPLEDAGLHLLVERVHGWLPNRIRPPIAAMDRERSHFRAKSGRAVLRSTRFPTALSRRATPESAPAAARMHVRP